MKPIPLNQIRRAAQRDVLLALNEAQTELNGLPDGNNTGQKGKFITNNSTLWSALKDELWKLGNMKCWYSEVVIECNLAEVEHFRPKKMVTGEQHCGYWWCAFKWDNYRISHPLVNKRLTDYQSGKKAGKGCYFPLHYDSPRAQNEAEQVNEKPLLIDPVIPSDCSLIAFDSSNGSPVPRFRQEENACLHQRAAESIDFYHLDEGTWNAKREDNMKAVANLCDRLMEIKSKNPFDLEQYNEIIDSLYKDYLNPYAEFLSASEQVLLEKGIDIRM